MISSAFIHLAPLAIDCTGEDPPFHCYYMDHNLWDGIFEPIVSGVGGWPILGILFAIPVVIGLYSWSETMYMPTIVVALLGGVILSSVPGLLATVGFRLIVMVTAFMLLMIWIRVR